MIKAILLLLCIFPTAIDAGVECTETAECEVIFRLGSECINGECSNPFYKEGCLKKLVPGWDKIRICNSEDGPDAIEQGICRGPNLGLEYPEIRILVRIE